MLYWSSARERGGEGERGEIERERVRDEREEWEREREKMQGLCHKTFTSVIDSSTVSHSHPSLVFTDKGGAYTSGGSYGTPLKG